MAKRINKAIELLEAGKPIYYTGVRELNYENGKAHAQTWADVLMIDLEHGPFDMAGLDAFMRGLVDGGPTPSGHRTPAVVATLPTDGTDGAVMRANAWMAKQVLARGVHGLLLCHAETPDAVQAFVESTRYPFQTIGVGMGLEQGRRGAGGQGYAAKIWGVSNAEYPDLADPWPLNPKGELLLGLKIENKRALVRVYETIMVPGIAFAEWGPGDMGMSFGERDAHDPPYSPQMEEARARVKAACDKFGAYFLNMARPEDVRELIDEGVRICAATEETAKIGRTYTG